MVRKDVKHFLALDISRPSELRFPGNGNANGTGDQNMHNFRLGFGDNADMLGGRRRPWG
jgi:hypothetical protein